jgi:hypothetical protein
MMFEDLRVENIRGVLGKEIWCAAREDNPEVMTLIVRPKAERDTKSFDRARTF